jgi:hypothetical protein
MFSVVVTITGPEETTSDCIGLPPVTATGATLSGPAKSDITFL